MKFVDAISELVNTNKLGTRRVGDVDGMVYIGDDSLMIRYSDDSTSEFSPTKDDLENGEWEIVDK